MYHYLKWAALSLFFRRNLRALVLIGISLAGMFFLDAVYQDLRLYLQDSGRKEALLYLLIGKWVLWIMLLGLLLYGIGKLGFGGNSRSGDKTVNSKKASGNRVSTKPALDAKTDAKILRRLEKFRQPGRLRRKSDLVMERLKSQEEAGE